MSDESTRRKFLGTTAVAVAAGWVGKRLDAATAPDQPEAGKMKTFRAGALAVDVTPKKFPVIINGGMTERTARGVVDPLHARCLVLDDGTMQIAMVVVDSCMVPRSILDEAKRLAQAATGIPMERMLISSTHTHSAPAVAGVLGSDGDEEYAKYLPGRIAEGIQGAQKNFAPGGSVGRWARTPRTCSAAAI